MRMMVMDLDGTLLNGEDKISACDREALLRAQNAGIITVIATGRPLKEALWCINEVNAYPYFIGMNGCQTLNLLTGEVYHQAALPFDTAVRILKVLGRLPVFFEAYTDKGIESLTCKKEWIYQSGLHENYIRSVLEYISFSNYLFETGQTVYKFFIPTDSAELSALLVRELSAIEGTAVITSLGHFVEVIPAGCNKAVGVAAVCRAAGIRPEQVLAVGDSCNDMEMLAYCGIGAVVGNARDEVKAAADILLPDHNHGGICAAVDYLLK